MTFVEISWLLKFTKHVLHTFSIANYNTVAGNHGVLISGKKLGIHIISDNMKKRKEMASINA